MKISTIIVAAAAVFAATASATRIAPDDIFVPEQDQKRNLRQEVIPAAVAAAQQARAEAGDHTFAPREQEKRKLVDKVPCCGLADDEIYVPKKDTTRKLAAEGLPAAVAAAQEARAEAGDHTFAPREQEKRQLAAEGIPAAVLAAQEARAEAGDHTFAPREQEKRQLAAEGIPAAVLAAQEARAEAGDHTFAPREQEKRQLAAEGIPAAVLAAQEARAEAGDHTFAPREQEKRQLAEETVVKKKEPCCIYVPKEDTTRNLAAEALPAAVAAAQEARAEAGDHTFAPREQEKRNLGAVKKDNNDIFVPPSDLQRRLQKLPSAVLAAKEAHEAAQPKTFAPRQQEPM